MYQQTPGSHKSLRGSLLSWHINLRPGFLPGFLPGFPPLSHLLYDLIDISAYYRMWRTAIRKQFSNTLRENQSFFVVALLGYPRYYMNYFIGNRVLNGVYRMHAFYANVRFWNNEHSEYGCRNKLESILRWKIKEQNRYGGIETFRGIKGIDCETRGRKIACSVSSRL